jgi:hypothetical protein
MPNLGEGYREVKKALGEGVPWFFDDQTIISRLNRSARHMCSEAQALCDTYPFTTQINPKAPSSQGTNGPTFYQEYAMPQVVEKVRSAKVQIGTMWPLDFKYTQQQLQSGGFVAGAPVQGYLRRGINMTGMIPGSSELVFAPPGGKVTPATWIIGLYQVPAGVYQCWADVFIYHPWMKDEADMCMIPEHTDFFEAWVAYAIGKGMADQGRTDAAQEYMAAHAAGTEKFKNYILAAEIELTPPRWGGQLYSGLNVGFMAPTAANLSMD